ncbi:MAG: hypothetical protein EOO27_17015 [Comamonadaceae bacterium]|nr:MAG: hypothetical protein EOO27_17015 [Comamonadaceae bacterium]
MSVEGLGVFLVVMLVLMAGLWILETVVDGVVTGLCKMIAAPFKAAAKAREKSKMDTYVNGFYFDTSAPADQLHKALSDHFTNGEFHPANKVIVQTNEDGRFVIGIAWHEQTEFQLEGVGSAYGSGLPVVVVELTYEARGPRTAGRMRLTRFPHELNWAENAILENIFPWCFSPIADLDPSVRLHKYQDVAPHV